MLAGSKSAEREVEKLRSFHSKVSKKKNFFGDQFKPIVGFSFFIKKKFCLHFCLRSLYFFQLVYIKDPREHWSLTSCSRSSMSMYMRCRDGEDAYNLLFMDPASGMYLVERILPIEKTSAIPLSQYKGITPMDKVIIERKIKLLFGLYTFIP